MSSLPNEPRSLDDRVPGQCAHGAAAVGNADPLASALRARDNAARRARGEGDDAGRPVAGLEAGAGAARSITLTLPYPISANVYWRSFTPPGRNRSVVIVSEEAKAYKQEVGWLARAAGIRSPLAGRVSVDIRLYPERPQDWAKRAQKDPFGWDDDVRCIDLDNARKVLLDALKMVAFDDDKWVWKDSGERMEPDEHGARVVVTITKIERPQSPQGSLL